MIKEIIHSISSSDKAGSVLKNQLVANEESTNGFFGKIMKGFQNESLEVSEEPLHDGHNPNEFSSSFSEGEKEHHLNEIRSSLHLNNQSALSVGVVKVDELEETADSEVPEVLIASVDSSVSADSSNRVVDTAMVANTESSEETITKTPDAELSVNTELKIQESVESSSSELIPNSQIAEEQVPAAKAANESENVKSIVQKEIIAANSENVVKAKVTPITAVAETETSSIETEAEPTSTLKMDAETGVKLHQVEGSLNNEVKKGSAAATNLTKKVEEVFSALNQRSQSSSTELSGESFKAKNTSETASDTVVQQVIKQKSGQNIIEVQQEITAAKNEDSREKRYNISSLTGGNHELISGERIKPVTDTGAGNQSGSYNLKNSEWFNLQSDKAGSDSLSEEQQAFLQENLIETNEFKENSKSEINFARLGEIPIANALIRRSVLPGLASSLNKTATSENGFTQTWQKHSFELDDGSKIELSTRNIDGVIQVKLASSSLELSKLMHQYGTEIKDHLEKECDLNIDLQFDEKQDQSMSDLFGDSSSGKQFTKQSGGTVEVNNQQAKQSLQNNVRKFGYNQMEWTA